MHPTHCLAIACASLLPIPAAVGQGLPVSWNRAAEWVPALNPGPGSGGNPVWSYKYFGGATRQSTWDPVGGQWVGPDNSAPIGPDRLTHLTEWNIWVKRWGTTPRMAWENKTGQTVWVTLEGNATIEWGATGTNNAPVGDVYVDVFHASPSAPRVRVFTATLNNPTGARITRPLWMSTPIQVLPPDHSIWWTVRTQNATGHDAWVSLIDSGLNVTRHNMVTATETVRRATPRNPLSFGLGRTQRPIIGSTWDPIIENSPAGALADFLFLDAGAPIAVPSPFGTLLCSPVVVVPNLPGAAFAIPIPNRRVLVGRSLLTQGGSVTPAGIALGNAIDIVVGDL